MEESGIETTPPASPQTVAASVSASSMITGETWSLKISPITLIFCKILYKNFVCFWFLFQACPVRWLSQELSLFLNPLQSLIFPLLLSIAALCLHQHHCPLNVPQPSPPPSPPPFLQLCPPKPRPFNHLRHLLLAVWLLPLAHPSPASLWVQVMTSQGVMLDEHHRHLWFQHSLHHLLYQVWTTPASSTKSIFYFKLNPWAKSVRDWCDQACDHACHM